MKVVNKIYKHGVVLALENSISVITDLFYNENKLAGILLT